MYQKGDFVTATTLSEKGFSFSCWFAGYHVYKTVDEDEKTIYVIYDFIKQIVVTSFKSEH